MTRSAPRRRPAGRSLQQEMQQLEERLGISPVSRSDLGIFTRQLASLSRSGVPIAEAILLLGSISDSPRFARIVTSIGRGIQQGQRVGDSFAAYPKVFDPIYCAMLAAGEETGQLEEILGRLADTIEKIEKLKKQVVSAAIYPVTVLVASLAITLGLIFFVVPIFTKLYADAKAQLPLPTQILVSLSEGLRQPIALLLGLATIGAAIWGIRRALQDRAIRLQVDRLLLRIPALGVFIAKNQTAAMIRILGTTMDAGLTLTDALRITQGVMTNQVFRLALVRARAEVATGQSLSSSLAATPEIPRLFVRLLAVGEESGDISGLIRQAAEIYETEVELGLKALTSMMEPLMILIVASVVGSVLVALYLPIFDMANVVTKR